MVMATSDSMLSATSGPDECQSLSTTCNCGECSWGTDQLGLPSEWIVIMIWCDINTDKCSGSQRQS